MDMSTTFPEPALQLRQGPLHGAPPGDLAVWFFICAELLAFGIFFLGYAIARRFDPQLFNSGQATLDTGAGLTNTLLLITSSYLVARAVRALHAGKRRPAVYQLLGACCSAATCWWSPRVSASRFSCSQARQGRLPDHRLAHRPATGVP
jgi:heme/copper-type cytochrome/quinol oxidase subunit 3